jgi:homopolymeric O-antigen transport system permease protein
MTEGQRHEAPRALNPVVRTPEPPLARPCQFAHTAWLDIRRSRPLALEMAKRDIRSQYRQTMFGAAVVVLPPLAMTAVALGFRRAGILIVDSLAIPYGLFALFGVILWTTFLDALNAPIHGLLAEQRLLARTNSPPEAVILGKLGHVVFNLGIRTVVLAAAIVWYGATVPATIIFAPLGLLALIALGTAIGLLLAPLNIIYRDVSKLVVTITTFWLFFSPVYFPAPAIGTIGTMMNLNPVTPLLSGTRALALTGNVTDPVHGISVALGTLLLLVFGWVYVRVALPVAIEQTSD